MSCAAPADEGQVAPIKVPKPKVKICKTCSGIPSVFIRHTYFCRPCFLISVDSKILKNVTAIKKDLSVRDRTGPLVVAFKGGAGGQILLDILQAVFFQEPTEKFVPPLLFERMEVVWVDVAALVPQTKDWSEEIARIVQGRRHCSFTRIKIEDAFELGEVSAYAASASVPHSITLDTEPQSALDRLKSLFAGKSITAQESLIHTLTQALLLNHARHIQARHIFLGTSATRLAIRLMDNICTGRGYTAGIEMVSGALRSGIQVHLPCRDSLAKELALAAYYRKLRVLRLKTLSTFSSGRESILQTTEALIVGLERNFPSTVATVAKTGSKLVFDPENKEVADRCIICTLPRQAGSEDWMRAVSATTDLNKDSVLQEANPSTQLRSYLCFGCALAYHNRSDSDHDLPLPQWSDATSNQQLSANSARSNGLKEVLSNFLLEDTQEEFRTE